MKIYTKTGDKGETQVYAKKAIRLSKDNALLETYGDLDELNAHIGMLISLFNDSSNQFVALVETLQSVQQDIFKIGFAISDSCTLEQERILVLERQIDQLQHQLPPQTHFILPGGSVAASQAHICRTTCRRAERKLVALSHTQPIDKTGLAYINRLSDYLFVVARFVNDQLQIRDIQV